MEQINTDSTSVGYPVAALPNPPVAAISVPTTSHSVLPSTVPSLAVEDIPVQPALSVVPSYPVAPPAVSAIHSFPVQVPYAIKTPVVQASLPVSTLSAVPSSPVQLPSSIKTPAVQPVVPNSTPVQLPYSIKTPAVQVPVQSYPAAPPVVGYATSSPVQLPYSIKTPAVQVPVPSYPAAPPPAPYNVKSAAVPASSAPYHVAPPAVSAVAAPYGVASPAVPAVSAVAAPYGVASPAVPAVSAVAAPYGVAPPAVSAVAAPYGVAHPAVSAVASPYGVASPAVPAVSAVAAPYGVAAPAVSAVAAPYGVASPAVPAVSAVAAPYGAAPPVVPAPAYPAAAESYPGHGIPSQKDICAQKCKAKCEGAENVADVGSCRASCLLSCANDVHPIPNIEIPKEKSTAKTAAVPGVVPGHGVSASAVGAGTLTWEACMESCNGRVQHADIAGDITQGSGGCTKACAGYAKSGASVNIKRNIKDIMPAGPKIGAGAESFEGCLKSCNGKWQHADIASDISTGKGSCQEACAAKHGYGAGVNIKRNVKDIMPTGPKIGAGATTYEACLKSCNAKSQHAGIASNIFQGKGGCAEACAAQTTYGAGVIIKKGVKDIIPTGPRIGAGAVTYESCMKDCHWKEQTAHIAFDVSQGKWSCKQGCARYASNGAGVVIKKEAVPLPAEE